MITMYSTPSCSICKQAEKDMLSRGVPYIKKDVEKDKSYFDEMYTSTEAMSVPQFRINEEWVVGYHRGILEKMVSVESESEDDFSLGAYANEKFLSCSSCEG